ncbi:hypothetical protein LEP1GSC072_1958 [Leptospira noguchii str. Bonito]|nr:hypothetical protein LEP1GSC072_1958 [Leptospira noguchii str. Bonito]
MFWLKLFLFHSKSLKIFEVTSKNIKTTKKFKKILILSLYL